MPKVESCCCGCSLRDGTLSLFVITLVLSILGLLISIASQGSPFLYLISIAVNAAGLYAVFKEKPGFLMPGMVCQIISLIFYIIMGILFLFFGGAAKDAISRGGFSPDQVKQLNAIAGGGIAVALVFFLAAALQYYFFVVVLSFYKKIQEFRSAA